MNEPEASRNVLPNIPVHKQEHINYNITLAAAGCWVINLTKAARGTILCRIDVAPPCLVSRQGLSRAKVVVVGDGSLHDRIVIPGVIGIVMKKGKEARNDEFGGRGRAT